MNEELSTQLPSTPDTQPTLASPSKSRRWLSLLLIVSGLALVTTGAWMYLQQYVEASKPPPARIVENSLAELEKTLTPAVTEATATPKPTNTPSPAPSPVNSLEETVAVKATSTPVEPTDTPPTQEEAGEESLSLADNPLLVAEDDSPETPGEEAAPQPAVDDQAPVATSTAPDQIPLTRIVAESIGLDSDIIPVGWQKQLINSEWVNVWTVADYAAGWHSNSVMPGQGGNVVLSGHHNIKGEVFRHIVDIEPGAIVTLYDDQQQPYNYIIEDKFIVKDKGEPDAVRQANAKWIGPFNEERLTLVTCWPYNNNTHRVIVIGKPADSSQTNVQ